MRRAACATLMRMEHDPILFSIFLIFSGAAVLATAALFARQSMLVSFILLGMLLGPSGIGLVAEPGLIQQFSHVGVIFLLFLLGLNLHPQKLLRLFRTALWVTLASSLLFATAGFGLALAFGFAFMESVVIATACMFSSTIIGLKLLPTTQLHHQHTGEVIISVLLLQDLIAIVLLLLLQAIGAGAAGLAWNIGMLALALPLVFGLALLGARYVVVPLFSRFGTIQEYIFLLTIGWCLAVAQFASTLQLSLEMGAFIAGVALASSPISTFIAESLKPLRDFFLVLFFFSLGASLDLGMMRDIVFPALALALLMIGLKPLGFAWLLRQRGESAELSREIGVRLGQVSEFSLFIAVLAADAAVIGGRASYLIQLTTLLTFIVSSYWIMLRYPTPIAVSAILRRD